MRPFTSYHLVCRPSGPCIRVRATALALLVGTFPPPCCESSELIAVQVVSREGVRGIYRGMGPPLVAVAAFNAILFSARGAAHKRLARPDGVCSRCVQPRSLRRLAACIERRKLSLRCRELSYLLPCGSTSSSFSPTQHLGSLPFGRRWCVAQ